MESECGFELGRVAYGQDHVVLLLVLDIAMRRR
jgi:hypothetical protein